VAESQAQSGPGPEQVDIFRLSLMISYGGKDGRHDSSSRSAFAAFKSVVSNPSVNQP